MKQLLLTLILIVFIINLSYSKNKVYDLSLEIAKKNTIDEINEFSTNPFPNTNQESTESESISPIGIGVTLTTKIVDATAKFLVERTKEEFILTFFDKFRNQIKNKPILKAIFPNTALLVKSQNYFLVPSMGKTWIGAFKMDLQEIPENLEKHICGLTNYKYQDEFKAFSSAIKIFRMQEQGIHPATIIKYIASQYNDTKNNIFDFSINLINLFSSNLRDSDNSTWLSFDKLQKMSEKQKKAFIALIYRDGLSKQLFDSSQINKNNYSIHFTNILELLSILEHTEIIIKNLKKHNNISFLKNYNEYSRYLYKILDWGINYSILLKDDTDNIKKLNKISLLLDKTFRTINAFQTNKIGLGLLYGLQLTEALLDSTQLTDTSFKKIVYYGNFMVDIAAADSTTQIKDIINKYSMPVGSYQVKRKSSFSIDLNAYPGLYIGWEGNVNFEPKSLNMKSIVNGVTAPIGFSLSCGYTDNSFSLFLSIIDIGAPFSYRWGNNSTQGLPENIKWEQIFSPGVHFVWGIKDAPVSIMAGIQYTPLLRQIKTDKNILNEINTIRCGITFAVDIPIFGLLVDE